MGQVLEELQLCTCSGACSGGTAVVYMQWGMFWRNCSCGEWGRFWRNCSCAHAVGHVLEELQLCTCSGACSGGTAVVYM